MTDQTPQIAVAGERMERSIAEFQRSCIVHIAEEQGRANPDNALIAVLCDAVRCSRELAAHAADAASLAALRREKESAENDWQTCDENLRHERLVNRQLQAEVSRLQQALTEAQQERDEARRMAEERSDVLIACMVEGSECAMEYLAHQPKAARLQSSTPQEPTDV